MHTIVDRRIQRSIFLFRSKSATFDKNQFLLPSMKYNDESKKTLACKECFLTSQRELSRNIFWDPGLYCPMPSCKGPFTLCNLYKTRNINVCQCLQMHSMTNLVVVNISYLKFSSNARGVMDSDRECTAAAIAIAVICKKRKRWIKKQCRQKRSD